MINFFIGSLFLDAMQTPPSSSSASMAGDSPRMQRRGGDPDTPRRLALPKMPNFLTLASPKRLQKDRTEHHPQENVTPRGRFKKYFTSCIYLVRSDFFLIFKNLLGCFLNIKMIFSTQT